MKILKDFHQASGQEVNLNKSEITLCKKSNEEDKGRYLSNVKNQSNSSQL